MNNFKLQLLFGFVVICLTAGTASAATNTDRFHLALKVSTIEFVGAQANAQSIDRGIYAALEAYVRVFPNLFFGGEFGSAGIDNGAYVFNRGIPWEAGFDFESYELNMKFVQPLSPLLDVEAGGGVALVSAGNVVDLVPALGGITQTYYAAQGFVGINLTGEDWYTGVNAKYQEVENEYSNWRGGFHLGYRFY